LSEVAWSAERNESRSTDGRIPRDNNRPAVDRLEAVRSHHLGRRAARSHSPFGQKHDRIGEAGDEIQLVAHEENGHSGSRQR
jgi:hypothetical protein